MVFRFEKTELEDVTRILVATAMRREKAGLMSDKPVEKVSEQVEKLQKAWVELGCTVTSPFLTMSLLALPALPELRITDKGLLDTQKFQLVSLLFS